MVNNNLLKDGHIIIPMGLELTECNSDNLYSDGYCLYNFNNNFLEVIIKFNNRYEENEYIT